MHREKLYSLRTRARNFQRKSNIKIRDFFLSEFDRNKRIYCSIVKVFDSPESQYDIILGRDYLQHLEMNVEYKHQVIRWGDSVVPLEHWQHWQNKDNWMLALDKHYFKTIFEEDMPENSFILDAKYEATTAHEVASKQDHLSKDQQDQLTKALKNTELPSLDILGYNPRP